MTQKQMLARVEQFQAGMTRRAKDLRRQMKIEDDARDAEWLRHVKAVAVRAGVKLPEPLDLSMLGKLASIEGAFTAAEVGRKGWCGIRSTVSASATLERLVADHRLFRLPPNRQGQTQYSFTRQAALGRLPHAERPFDSLTIWNADTSGRLATKQLIAAEFLHAAEDDDEAGDTPVAECLFCEVPDTTLEGDVWKLARTLAYEEGTRLHRMAADIEGLSPIHKAYALAIAQSKVESQDPIRTNLRGIAEYLGMDYNTLRKAVATATSTIRQMETNT